LWEPSAKLVSLSFRDEQSESPESMTANKAEKDFMRAAALLSSVVFMDSGLRSAAPESQWETKYEP